MYPKFKYIVLSLFLFIASLAFAQQNSRSPYSLFGVGALRYDGFADNIATGRNGISYRHESNFTFTNPASLSALKHATFNVGTYIELGQFHTNTVVQNFSNAGFNYIALGIPLKKIKSGLGFGLLPYSDVGYNIINSKDSAGISVRNEFEGMGGLSKFNLSFGSNPWKYLSLGFNYSYLFGELNESMRRQYPGNRFIKNYADINQTYLSGHHLDLGIQLHTISNTGLSHAFGAVLSNNSKLKGERDRVVYNYIHVFADDEESFRDTLYEEQDKATSITLPHSLSLSYTIGNHEKWQATLGYSKTLWSKYINVFGGNSGFSDDQGFSAGFFICPRPNFDPMNKDASKRNYFQSIRYAAGVRHNTGYINALGNTISESALSVGLGFPFTKYHKNYDGSRTIITSRVFITGEFVRKGTTSSDLIEENFFRLTLGLNLADNWFKKRLFN